MLEEELKDRKDFEARLGGKYIDEEGKLHVNFVGDINSIPEDIKLAGVEYHSTQYTLKELQDIANILNSKHEELIIRAVGVNEKLNKVMVELADLDSEVIEKINKVVDPSALEIRQQNPNLRTVFTSSSTK